MQQAAKLLAAMQLACHPRSCFYVCATGRISTYIGIVTGDVGMPEYQHQCLNILPETSGPLITPPIS